MDALCLKSGIGALPAAATDKPSVSSGNLRWGFTFRHSLRSLWPGWKNRSGSAIGVNDAVLAEEVEESGRVQNENDDHFGDDERSDQECDMCAAAEDDEKIEFSRESFSNLLRKVSFEDTRLYARMSYLGTLAYSISEIKPGDLLKYHGLRFLTSSVEKKGSTEDNSSSGEQVETASSMQHHAMRFLSFNSSPSESFPNATAVVAAKDEVKQAVADDLNSTRTSPCEWFACDDDRTATRFFVIQGSESMASWQANLLFEPILFEGLDVLVHRGIYEAAKGIYNQMLPEIHSHLKSHGDRATFRFTGHSLGGSLSLLVSLMLLVRGEVTRTSLLPVISFGAPSVMCGGDGLLRSLGLPRNHLRSIMMHRDIVPRAFSCHYPNHVAQFLQAVNGNFRNHPCLITQKLLYAPMGEFLILQPDNRFSPNHHLLPPGSGLYVLSCPVSDADNAEKQVLAAQSVFLNSPHPLDILGDRSAYGSQGTVQRDHDIGSYLKSLRHVIHRIRKTKTERSLKVWWRLYAPNGVNAGIVVSQPATTVNLVGQVQYRLTSIVQSGSESLRRFSTLLASQHMHLLVVLLLPARSWTGDV